MVLNLQASATDQQLQQARDAMLRWRRDGRAVDPDNPSHIDAYLLVRKTSQRPALDRVLATIASATATLSRGAAISNKFWMVRAGAFPEGVPDALKRHHVTVRELQERYDCGETNMHGMVMFHQTVGAQDLPPWSSQVTFFQKTTLNMGHKGATEDASEAAPAPAPALAASSAEDAPAHAPAPAEPPAVLVRPPPPALTSAEKRRRVLRQYDSSERDDDEEQALNTHATLIQKCEKAVKDENFAGTHNSLQFWAGQVLQSIKSPDHMQQDRPQAPEDAMVQLLKETFGCFMVKALLDARCFDSLSALAPVLRDLSSAGVKMPKVWDVVHNMAAADLGDPNFAHASICKTSSNRMLGLETRMVVFASKLYSDFLQKRTESLLAAAKKAETPENRQELLSAAKICHQAERGVVSPDLVNQVDTAMSIFGACASPATALAYVLQDHAARLPIAEEFHACKGDVSWAAVRMMKDGAAPVDVLQMPEFLYVGFLAIEVSLLKKVTNPVCKAVLDYWEFLQRKHGPFAGWVQSLGVACASARLGVASPAVFQPSDIPKTAVVAVFGRTATLLKSVKKKPSWFDELCEMYNQICEEDEADLKKALESAAAKAASEREAAGQAGAETGAMEVAEVATPEGAALEEVPAPALAAEAPALEEKGEEEQGDAVPEVWYVGDIVRMKNKSKDFRGFTAQIEATTKAYMKVRLLEGPKKNGVHRASVNLLELVHPSTLRPLEGGQAASSGSAPAVVAAPAPAEPSVAGTDTASQAQSLYGDGGSWQVDDENSESAEESVEAH